MLTVYDYVTKTVLKSTYVPGVDQLYRGDVLA
jgi:hypothetical protein